jgi:hypothetical protein
VLRFEQGGRLAIIKGRMAGEPTLLQLEQKAACADAVALLAALPGLNVALTNHSGAEYSFYDASGAGANYRCVRLPSFGGPVSPPSNVAALTSRHCQFVTPVRRLTVDAVACSLEAIWPASDRVIARKTPAEIAMVEETAAIYAELVEPYVAEQAG